MNIVRFINEVHGNAVAHGWWENDNMPEKIALIHSEWSEALEEYRGGRPMIWHACMADGEKYFCEECTDCATKDTAGECLYHDKKPEGIAVELIDGAIRILDFFGSFNAKVAFDPELSKNYKLVPQSVKEMCLPELVAFLHYETSKFVQALFEGLEDEKGIARGLEGLANAFVASCAWVDAQGIDTEQLLLEKHEYNKSRTYRHDGKRC